MENMYTVKEVSNMLKLHIETIRRNIYKGEIKAVKIGREWRISESELKRIMEGR